jgi:Kef-type K+ transport system membrane component KefB
MLLVQILVIIAASRLAGTLFKKLGQTQVVGEMAAGILLGPSFLGWLAPELSARLFPPGSLNLLEPLSQVGLILFLFIVGLTLDLTHLREDRKIAIVTSNASVALPFFLGAALGWLLYERVPHASASRGVFALFIGAAMSITAFPVLARILRERSLDRTRLGTIAISCAAVDDVTAWLILAAIVAFARADSSATPFLLTLLWLAVYLLVMWFVVRTATRHGNLTAILLTVFASAAATAWIGVHPLFGAFVAGVVMPKDPVSVKSLAERIEPIATELLLPIFFALTGLRTSFGSIDSPAMWAICALLIAAAVAGKWGGGMLAARWMGMPWSHAAALGVLMNTRGLVELVILNIGLELKILSPEVFSMMVLMALLTTFMTGPLLAALSSRLPRNA